MPRASFNSIKVQLRHKAYFDNFYPNRFQFHKGTIKASISYDVEDGAPTFNSIKVQLRPSKGKALRKAFIFQFHKGTIKA